MPDPRKPTAEEFNALLPKYNQAVQTEGGKSTVCGVDIGYVYVDGHRTDDIAVRIHLIGKGDVYKSFLASALVPGIVTVRANYTRGFPAAAQTVLPANPIQPGISISNEGTAGGTIGLIVIDKTTGEKLVLSGAHVLGEEKNASKEWVIQPAVYLDGTSTDDGHLLGRVKKSIDDIDGDAAVATNQFGRAVRPEQFTSGVIVTTADAAVLGDKVEKDGMGTRVSCGFVDGIGQYWLRGAGGLPMKGFRIARGNANDDCTKDVSADADCGSVWYRKSDQKGLGLHTGGDVSVANETIRPAIACHLQPVLDRLNVRI